MCGRFTITISADNAREDLGIVQMPDEFYPRYNVAPTQPIAVVLNADERKAEWMKWGLIPFWAKDPSIASKLINARSETITEKPTFKTAFIKRRCLVLADGFYEWMKGGAAQGRSQPYFFKLEDNRPFAFAGLWDSWRSPRGEEVRSCTIITCEANDIVKPVHLRMPVMLSGEDMWAWLHEGKAEDHQALLRQYSAELMKAYPVSSMVNRTDLDIPELIQPIAAS